MRDRSNRHHPTILPSLRPTVVRQNSSALYVGARPQPGVATLTWNSRGSVRLFGADSQGLLFDGVWECGPLDGPQVLEWTVHSAQVRYNTCTKGQSGWSFG